MVERDLLGAPLQPWGSKDSQVRHYLNHWGIGKKMATIARCRLRTHCRHCWMMKAVAGQLLTNSRCMTLANCLEHPRLLIHVGVLLSRSRRWLLAMSSAHGTVRSEEPMENATHCWDPWSSHSKPQHAKLELQDMLLRSLKHAAAYSCLQEM